MAPDSLMATGTLVLAASTVLLAIVAVFQDRIRAWVMQPRLDISVAGGPPDCHKTEMAPRVGGQVRPVYYLRFRVRNSGSRRAELVEVYAEELLRQQADGSFRRVDEFLPMNFLWSHIGQPILGGISPGMEKWRAQDEAGTP